MTFKHFKNTYLFQITTGIGIVLMIIACGSKSEGNLGFYHKTLKPFEDDKPIIVGANRTGAYLDLLAGKSVGIISNQASVIFKDGGYTHIVDSLISLQVKVTRVFSPEHGFRGASDAGESVKDGKDIRTGLPLISLYGKVKKPKSEHLEGLDILIFDAQDVGVRFYTYISTLHYVMEACAEHDIPLIIFDRPNPNGSYVDGPTLEEEHRSFLGMHTVPLVHGMTIGEFAKMINGEGWLKGGITCDITVIPLAHYTHASSYSLPIRPSPNLPNDLAVKLYPSLGLFEGTNINAGRGTEFQFQRYGAPFLDSTKLSLSYIPRPNFGAKYPKHKDTRCYGEDLSLNDHKPGFTLKWIIKAYESSLDKTQVFNTDNFTKHAGTATLQQQIELGMTEAQIKATWQEDLEAFRATRAKYLIYD
jgi:uncharacterized protein YbbC (DUF1343 family)